MFGDQIWLWRFTGDATVKSVDATTIAESVTAIPDWVDLRRRRIDFDAALIGWKERMTPSDLPGDVTWFSGAMGQNVTRP